MGAADRRPGTLNRDAEPSETASGRLWRDARRWLGASRARVSVPPETLARAKSDWRTAGAEKAEAGDTLSAWPPPDPEMIARLPARTLRFPGEPEEAGVPPADYELVRLIGVGGMGEVWQARQPALGLGAAVKLPKRAGDLADTIRFATEAKLTRQLQYSGVVTVLEVGRACDGRPFYAMSENVGALWRQTLPTMDLKQNLAILINLAFTLQYAHSRGIVHRDLKPENVLLREEGVPLLKLDPSLCGLMGVSRSDLIENMGRMAGMGALPERGQGEALLGDWGVAASISGDGPAPGLSPETAFAGTPRYMAPEQAAGDWRRIGVATDVYLLGAVLLEILTGQPPHDGADTVEALHHALRNNLPPESRKRTPLMQVARKALATRPEDRHANASHFAHALTMAVSP